MSVNFNRIIDRHGTYSTQWDFAVDRFGRNDVLPFSISDMDFQTSPEILQAIDNHVKHGIFGYTRWNHNTYKSAIVHWYNERFVAEVKSDWIVYSPSVIYTISKLIEILTDERDKIIIQTPGYDAFFKQIDASNRELIKNPLIYENGSYSIDFEHLEEKLADKQAKVLLFCNPHNPTGRVWNKEELRTVVQLCEKHAVKIISDDIHMDIVFKGNAYTPITSITEERDNVFICTSASKTFNTPSLGGSYAFIPNENVRAAFVDILKQRDGLSSATIFGILSVIEGYNHSAYWVDELVSYVANNMTLLSDFIQNELPSLTFEMPESTYLAWIDCSKLSASEKDIQRALVDIGNVGIMSGKVYHANEGKFLRMNVGCPQEKLIDGLERLKKSIFYLEGSEG